MGKIKFLNKMFSVQNQYSKDIKYKVLKILGFEIKIKTNKKQQIVPNFREIRLELTNMCGCHCYMCPRDNMTRKQGVISVSNLSTILSNTVRSTASALRRRAN